MDPPSPDRAQVIIPPYATDLLLAPKKKPLAPGRYVYNNGAARRRLFEDECTTSAPERHGVFKNN